MTKVPSVAANPVGYDGLLGRDGTVNYLDKTKYFSLMYLIVSNANQVGQMQYSGGGIGIWISTKDIVGVTQGGTLANNYFLADLLAQANIAPPGKVDILMFLATDLPNTRTQEWGWSDIAGPGGSDRIVFEYDPSADTNFYAVIESTTVGSPTRVDTGIAFVADAFHKFCIEIDDVAQEAKFYIDDVLVATITAISHGGWPTGMAKVQYTNQGSGSNRVALRLPWILALEL